MRKFGISNPVLLIICLKAHIFIALI